MDDAICSYISIEQSDYSGFRHWIFRGEEGSSEVEVPKYSPGVLNLNPIILPSECFQYMSMVHLESTRGSMEGSFLMENQTSKQPLEVKVGLCHMSSDVFFTA